MTDDDPDDNTPRERPATYSERIARLDNFEQRMQRLADRDEEQQLDIASLLASRRSWRWIAGLGIPVLLTSIVVVMLWAVDRSSVSAERTGRAEATMESLLFRLNLLEGYVHELLRHAGLAGKPLSIVQTPDAAAVPMSCGGGCTTSPECQGTGRCNYCYLGKCSAVLPAEPTRDAGADAPVAPADPDPLASDPSKGPHHALVSNP